MCSASVVSSTSKFLSIQLIRSAPLNTDGIFDMKAFTVLTDTPPFSACIRSTIASIWKQFILNSLFALTLTFLPFYKLKCWELSVRCCSQSPRSLCCSQPSSSEWHSWILSPCPPRRWWWWWPSSCLFYCHPARSTFNLLTFRNPKINLEVGRRKKAQVSCQHKVDNFLMR